MFNILVTYKQALYDYSAIKKFLVQYIKILLEYYQQIDSPFPRSLQKFQYF
jgi:hypothetical protein